MHFRPDQPINKVKLISWSVSVLCLLACFTVSIIQGIVKVEIPQSWGTWVLAGAIPPLLITTLVFFIMESEPENLFPKSIANFSLFITKAKTNPPWFTYTILGILFAGIAVSFMNAAYIPNSRIRVNYISKEARIASDQFFIGILIILHSVSSFLLCPFAKKTD